MMWFFQNPNANPSESPGDEPGAHSTHWCYGAGAWDGIMDDISIYLEVVLWIIWNYMYTYAYFVYIYCVEYNLEQITSRNRCLPFLTDATPKPSNGLFDRFSHGHCPIMVLLMCWIPSFFFDRHPTPTTVGCQQSAFLGRSMLQWRGRRGTGAATPKSMASSSNLHRITI
jgi:hypothetical protein